MSKLNGFVIIVLKHNMEPKYEIGLSLHGSEHKGIQEFGLGAAEKWNVQTLGHMFQQLILIF